MTRETAQAAALVLSVAACGPARTLRGEEEPNADGRTALTVEETHCPVTIDGDPWPAAVHVPGPIAAGAHRIGCVGQQETGIEFVVREGTTFHFDYWGP